LVSEIKLYVEGGGKGSHKFATLKLQQGFDSFFRELKEAARERKISFKIIPSANTQSTYDDFIRSVENSPQSFNILLVDSDLPLEENETARGFLQKKFKKWDLKKIADEQCHLMVQIMESWFLADKEKLAVFYKQKFNINALPKDKNVEKIPKTTVEKSLANATKNTQPGEYHKINHGGKILELIDSAKVRDSAPNCDKLFQAIIKAIE